jgi:electron transport complex protein RnfD
MLLVIASLVPAAAAGVYFFGVKALYVILASCASALAFEYICNKLMGRNVSVYDGSALLTGLLLALTLPPHVPLWIPVVGAFVSIAVAKQAFGGLGANIFNPALVGRVFLLASWPILMTSWPQVLSPGSPVWLGQVDAVTSATPLGLRKTSGLDAAVASLGSREDAYTRLFLGSVGGSLGETSALLLLLGGLYLILKDIIDFRIPAGFVGSVFILSALLGEDPLFHILSGGLILGAFFMATDYVTSPTTKNGRLLFALGCGVITVAIRFYSGLPEGVSYAILIMNALTPLIDRHIRPRRFGT